MINLSELQTDIKNINIEIIKHHLLIDFSKNKNNLLFFIELLRIICEKNPKCVINLNDKCLNKGTIWCTRCSNWICENCSKNIHLCNNIYKDIKIDYIRDLPKIYINKNNKNIGNICTNHNKPYLFYCDCHGLLCELCEDCDLTYMKKLYDYSHGPCYFGPIMYFKLQSKMKYINEKIEKSIKFFNSYIFKLYNDNKNKY